MSANSVCFLLEHVWTCDLNNMTTQLKKSPKLIDQLATVFNIPPPAETQSYFNDSMQISTAQSFAQTSESKIVENTVSKYNGDAIISAFSLSLGGEDPNKESNEPKQASECSFEEFAQAMQSTGNLPENANENYLRKMYENFLSRNEGSGTTLNYNWMDDDGMITIYLPIPVKATKKSISSILHSSSWKLSVEGKVLIDGVLFSSVKHDDSFWSIESPGIFCMTLEKVDKNKTWTELIKGECQLSSDEILTKSWLKNSTEEMYLTEVLDTMWKYSQTYSIASQQGGAKQPMWYIMDQYGSAFTHNNIPNFKCSPFFYLKNNKAYSIIWPINNLRKGELCTRNFIPQIMANETLDICKVRMKAFLGKNILQENNSVNVKKDLPQIYKGLVTKDCKDDKAHQSSFSNIYNTAFSKATTDMLMKKIENVTFVEDSQKADISIKPLNDIVVSIDQDFLPAKEMLANKDYLSSYLKFRTLHHEKLYIGSTFILPRDLVEFNQEFELSNLPTYWIIKPVSKELIDIPLLVSSQFARVCRTCEAGAISVSQYVTDQAVFRDSLFSLSYTVCVLPNKTVYIYKLPYMRMAEEKINPNNIINEYDPKPLISCSKKTVSEQADWYDELKISINKKVLLVDPDFKFTNLEQDIYKKVGSIAKCLADDVHLGTNKDNVMFSIDVILTSDLNAFITDVDGSCNLPNDNSYIDIMNLFAKGTLNSNFVMIS